MFSRFQPFGKKNMVFNDLLFPRLHCKITLGKRNLFLAWITVLGDKVTGIAGEKDIFNIPFPPFGNRYRFVGVNKMI